MSVLRLLSCFSLAASLGLLPAGAASALPDWGTRTTVSTADCPSFCTNFDFGASTGGYNETLSEASVDTFRGNAQASAELDASPGLSVPILKAEAYSESPGQGSAFATAFAVEGYTYMGGGTGEFTLDITLTGSVFDPTPLDRDTFIQADIYIFEENPFAFIGDIPTLVFEVGAVEIDSTTLRLDPDVTNGVLNGSVSFSLEVGESVYLWANLDAEAQRDLGYADAFATLTTSFVDSTGLVASSVPEPGTAALLALAGLALGVRRRR
jgi:hypothetical protein